MNESDNSAAHRGRINAAAAAHLERRRAERARKEAEVLARHGARLKRNDAVREYRAAKANGTLPSATPQNEIGDVGGYDNNGNLL